MWPPARSHPSTGPGTRSSHSPGPDAGPQRWRHRLAPCRVPPCSSVPCPPRTWHPLRAAGHVSAVLRARRSCLRRLGRATTGVDGAATAVSGPGQEVGVLSHGKPRVGVAEPPRQGEHRFAGLQLLGGVEVSQDVKPVLSGRFPHGSLRRPVPSLVQSPATLTGRQVGWACIPGQFSPCGLLCGPAARVVRLVFCPWSRTRPHGAMVSGISAVPGPCGNRSLRGWRPAWPAPPTRVRNRCFRSPAPRALHPAPRAPNIEKNFFL